MGLQRLEALNAEVRQLRESLSAAQRELARQKQERELLARISRCIELQPLLDLLGAEVLELGPFDGYMINLADEARQNLVCAAIRLPGDLAQVEPTYRGFKFPFQLVDANVACFQRGASLLLDAAGAEHYPGTTKNRFERWRMSSLLIVPIVASGEPVGTMMVFRCTGGIDVACSEPLQARCELFAKQIRNAQFLQDIRAKEREIRQAATAHKEFLHFVERINALNSLNSIFELITEEFLRRYPFDLASVLTVDQDRLVVRKLAVADERFRGVQLEVGKLFHDNGYVLAQEDGATPTVFLQNTQMFFPDAQEIMDLPMSARDRASLQTMGAPRTILLVPIRNKGEPNGVLWLVSLDRVVSVSDTDREFIELLCSFVGTALANAELYAVVGRQHKEIERLNHHLQEKVEELRQLASRDGLTGLSNFGAFESELVRRMNEYGRVTPNDELSLVILDVDHFKRFNDTYGHIAGNMVLQEVAARIRGISRKMDIPCRYGGEEFVVILPKCKLDGARVFAERLREAVAERPFAIDEGEVQVTISLGCATFRGGEDMAGFVDRADQALYAAKQAGRNQVMVAQ